MSEHYIDIKQIRGTDNVSDLAVVSVPKVNGIFVYGLDNVDIDDSGKPHRRDGYGEPIYSGSGVRSLWANDKICLFADGTDFKYLDHRYSASTIISGVDATKDFSYVEHGDLVFFSTPLIIGYVNADTATPHPFPEPNQTFKAKMVGGQILEWHYNRLFAGNGNNLFFSDATVPTRMDTRRNAIAFPSRITMVKSVDDGLYVSDSERVYFMAGRDPMSDFVQQPSLDVPAIEGMSVTVPVRGKVTKTTVYWMTKKGPYAGYNSGQVVPQQKGLYNLDGLESGTAIIRDGTYQQLLMVGKYA